MQQHAESANKLAAPRASEPERDLAFLLSTSLIHGTSQLPNNGEATLAEDLINEQCQAPNQSSNGGRGYLYRTLENMLEAHTARSSKMDFRER